jgi:hypothetical protein
MPNRREAARTLGGGAGGGANGSSGRTSFCTQHTTSGGRRQGPRGRSPVGLKGDMIWCEGRHLARVRDGVLHRTFDETRELLWGALFFRLDVLNLAQGAGATIIVARERTSGQTYRVALAEFLRRGKRYDHKVYGLQVGLPLTDFERDPEPGAARQLALFEVTT